MNSVIILISNDLIQAVLPIASLINVTERRACGKNVASKKMLPEPGNLFELHFYDVS